MKAEGRASAAVFFKRLMSDGFNTADLPAILQRLAATAAQDALAPFWAESARTFPSGAPAFLRPEVFLPHCEAAGLPDEARPALEAVAERVRRSAELTALAWHCDRLVFEHDEADYPRERFAHWPTFDASLGDLGGAFYLLLALDCVPRIESLHRAKGLPANVTRDTRRAPLNCLNAYRVEFPGRVGAQARTLHWMRHHVTGRLYEVGRFQYMLRPFRPGQRVYRREDSGETIVLAEDGVAFRDDGFVDPPGEEQAPPAWTTRLVESDEAFVGFPVSPLGRGINHEVRLARPAWRRVLAPGDLAMEIHIPPGGRMTLEACRESMERAGEFFARHFADQPARAFVCWSWVFSPNLEEFLPPGSNLVRVARETYRFPGPSPSLAGLHFIFGHRNFDPATAARDNSLRRAIVEHVERGGEVRAGGMLVLPEDLARVGAQPYISFWPLGELSEARA